MPHFMNQCRLRQLEVQTCASAKLCIIFLRESCLCLHRTFRMLVESVRLSLPICSVVLEGEVL